MPGHHGGSSSSSSNSSSNSSGDGGGRTDAQSQYGGTTGYNSSDNQSDREQSYGGGDNNTVDHGLQQALKKQAIRQADPVYGDPDPEVDVDPRDRDSITSFKDNYVANVKSNPMYLGIGGLLHTAYQTSKAKSILSGVPGYEFLDYGNGNSPTVQPIAGGGGENTTALLAASPYLVSGITQVESEASKWYNSIGNNTKQFNFASAYATAKEKVSQTLNNKGPIGMLAVSDSPYYDWLKTNKLDRGIL
jgi:hypothetical protein